MENNYKKNFTTEYQKLNLQQKDAVDSIDGPVMVIAGAGTGKTQTISLRIANILQKTDTNATSILCLTYTDVAANNMKQRLLSLIGPDAYKVKICTFHSFCNEIISSNSQYFPFASSTLKSLDELGTIEIVRDIIDSLDNSSPLISWGDRYCYQKSIIDAITLIKRENIDPNRYLKLVDDQEYFFSNTKDLISKLTSVRATKGNYPQINQILDQLENYDQISINIKSQIQVIRSSSDNLSQVKNEIRKFHQNFEKNIPKQKELIKIFLLFQSHLEKKSLYDYQDMILFVINAFSQYPDLLRNYQEKYQYILVDEYQDTNSSQNQIIEMLGSYYDNPNIFVVGDDDQSIFRFQGASLENIYSFYQRYNPKKIVLKNNYRSHKLILDSSQSVISKNKNRIANLIEDIDKSLIASKDYDPDPINLIKLNSSIEEDYYVAQKISTLIKNGQNPGEIAVLLRKNRDAQELTKMLSSFNIKYFLPSTSNILQNPLIIQLLNLLEFIENPKSSVSAYHVLSSPFIRLNSVDLLKILKEKTKLSKLLFTAQEINTLDISPKSKDKILSFGRKVARTRLELENISPERLFNKILKRFKILKYLLSKDDAESLNHIYVFYLFLKDLALNNNFTLKDFIKRLHLYLEYNLSIPAPPLDFDSSDSIKILTVHGAKGLEFDHVFIYRLIEDSWEKQRDFNKLKLPFGILKSEITKTIEDDFEEDRRLFYVALTRAKKQIYLSYSAYKENGKIQNPSVFVSEIDNNLIENIQFNNKKDALKKYYEFANSNKLLSSSLSIYLKNYLQNEYKFNLSHLNSYLRCPLCFYYKTILKIPKNKDKFSSFGTAIHNALSSFYKGLSSKEVFDVFQQTLINEKLSKSNYQWCLEKGKKILLDYQQNYQVNDGVSYECEYNLKNDNLFYKNIPLTGKIDLIERVTSRTVNVYDFKTGNVDNKYKDLSPDGNYYRQIVFYKLLLDLKNDPAYHFNKGIIDFVEKSKTKKIFIRKEINISNEDMDKLKLQIEEVYRKILNLDFFTIGKDCKDNDHLHYLIK